MIDFHSHLLPCMDDGSSSVDESLSLLNMLAQQGVELVCATPHFDPSRDSPSSFLERRQLSYEKIVSVWPDNSIPHITLGAEVMYFSGISGMENLSQLCIRGSKLLLLEMPFVTWSEYMMREIINISSSGEVTIMLAHIERYLSLQNASTWKRLADNGILMQSNASFFINLKTRRKALRMLRHAQIHFLGSDCHNVQYRPPRIDEAISIIERKLGLRSLDALWKFNESFFIG